MWYSSQNASKSRYGPSKRATTRFKSHPPLCLFFRFGYFLEKPLKAVLPLGQILSKKA